MPYSTKRRLYSKKLAASLIVSATTLSTHNAGAHFCVNDISVGLTTDQVDGGGMEKPIGIVKNYQAEWQTVAGEIFTNHMRYENLTSLQEPDRIVVEYRTMGGGSRSPNDDGISYSSASYRVVFGYLKDGEIIKDADNYDVFTSFQCIGVSGGR